MSELKEFLTNEAITERFSSQFELVNYAIALVADIIQTGRDPRVRCDSENPVHHVLTEILNNKEGFTLEDEAKPDPDPVWERTANEADPQKKVLMPSQNS